MKRAQSPLQPTFFQKSFNSQITQPSNSSKCHVYELQHNANHKQLGSLVKTRPFQAYYFVDRVEDSEPLSSHKKIKKLKNEHNDITLRKSKQSNLQAKKILNKILRKNQKQDHQRTNSITVPQNFKKNFSKEKYIKINTDKKTKYCLQLRQKGQKSADSKRLLRKRSRKTISNENKKKTSNKKKIKRTVSMGFVKNLQCKIHKNQKQSKKKLKPLLREFSKKRCAQNQKYLSLINMISKICTYISTYRESYELAVFYFRSTFPHLKTFLQKQALVFASIVLALKMTDGSIGKKFLHEIACFHEPQLKYENKCSDEYFFPKNKKQKFLERFNEGKKKNHRMVKYLQKIPQFLSSYERYIPKKAQIVELELEICQRLNFKLTHETYSGIVDCLAESWDIFVLNEWKKNENLLLFRSTNECKKISYLFQIVQLVFVNEYFDRNPLLIVLSALYLIVRATTESKNGRFMEILKKFKNNQNFIYTDYSGANEIFITFLDSLSVQFQQLSRYCSHILKYASNEHIKAYNFCFGDTVNHHDTLSIHQHNQDLLMGMI